MDETYKSVLIKVESMSESDLIKVDGDVVDELISNIHSSEDCSKFLNFLSETYSLYGNPENVCTSDLLEALSAVIVDHEPLISEMTKEGKPFWQIIAQLILISIYYE